MGLMQSFLLYRNDVIARVCDPLKDYGRLQEKHQEMTRDLLGQ